MKTNKISSALKTRKGMFVLLLALALMIVAADCAREPSKEPATETIAEPVANTEKGADDKTSEDEDEGGIWRVGIFDLDLPPLFYTDANGDLVGFEIDLVKEVAGRIGGEIEIVRVDDKYAGALEAGEVDVVWGNIPDTEAVRETVLLTKPYLRTNQVAVVARDSGIETKADLDGKNIAAIMWTPADRFLTDHTFGIRFKQVGHYKPYRTAFDALQEGAVSVVICDETMPEYILEEMGDGYYVLPAPLGEVCYAIAFRTDDAKANEKVQSALDAIAMDGTGEKISVKRFDKNLYID